MSNKNVVYRENGSTASLNRLIKEAGVQMQKTARAYRDMVEENAALRDRLEAADRFTKLSEVAWRAARRGSLPYEEIQTWVNKKSSEGKDPSYYEEVFRNAEDRGIAYVPSKTSAAPEAETRVAPSSPRAGQLIEQLMKIG